MTLHIHDNDVSINETKYWLLLGQLIALLDIGRFDELNIEDVKLHARGGAISVLLGEVFQRTTAFNVFTEDDWKSFNEEIARMANATDPPQKITVTNRGIALLMTWALEGARRQI
jgi:hypothetical protein